MKALSKLFVIVFGIILLNACSFLGTKEESTEVTNAMPTIDSNVDEMVVVDEEVLDAEVDGLSDEESAIDEELDTLDAEGL